MGCRESVAPKDTGKEFYGDYEVSFKPSVKYRGERTGLVVMGLDYSGLIIENTDEGLELAKVECKEPMMVARK